MSKFTSYGGIGVVAATFPVKSTTFNAIKDDLDSAVGKGVTLTDDAEVGFGISSGSPLFGIIQKVENDGYATIIVSGFVEDVPAVAVGETPALPAVGEHGLGVDDEGQIQTLATGKRGTVIAVGTDTATILL